MQKKHKLSLRDWAAGILLTAAPFAALFYGVYGLDDRRYLFVSLVVLSSAILAFFLLYERRKPPARDLVTLSVLCAIAVAGRAAFFMLPQFKPVVAIVTIAGVCFGPRSGFLVGAMTAFVSNFFFGQGPNTPWQMIAFGIIGFLAGIIFDHSPIKPNRISLCIFGGLTTFFLYGGIVNFGTVLIAGLPLTLPSFLAVCATGFLFDLIHAASSVFFLYFISQPMLEKLQRMKTKYGILQKEDDGW